MADPENFGGGGGFEAQNLKNSDVFTKIESDFSAEIVTFRSVGGGASRNGAELFEIEADFSAKIVTFRLVGGGCIPPIPPLNPPLVRFPIKMRRFDRTPNKMSSGMQFCYIVSYGMPE